MKTRKTRKMKPNKQKKMTNVEINEIENRKAYENL